MILEEEPLQEVEWSSSLRRGRVFDPGSVPSTAIIRGVQFLPASSPSYDLRQACCIFPSICSHAAKWEPESSRRRIGLGGGFVPLIR